MRLVMRMVVLGMAMAMAGCQSMPWRPERAMKKGQWEKAVKRYSRDVKNRHGYHSYMGRAYAYAELGKCAEAMADFAKAATLRPRDGGMASLGEAKMAMRIGELDRASAAADAALRVSDSNTDAFFVRGVCAVLQKDYKKGKSALLIVRNKFDVGSNESIEVLRNLGVACLHLKEFAQAREYYKQYLAEKQDAGRYLLEEDYYWAGVIADVNLDDEARDKYWSMLSSKFKRQKGVE